MGNLETSGEFFTMFSTGLVEPLPVSNYEALTFTDRNWLLRFFAPKENHTTAGLAKLVKS